jgi:hypothetical protein
VTLFNIALCTYIIVDFVDEVSGADLIRSLKKLCNATMLCAGVTPASIDELLTLLEPWLRSSLLTHRTTATILLSSALTCYAAHLQFGFEVLNHIFW